MIKVYLVSLKYQMLIRKAHGYCEIVNQAIDDLNQYQITFIPLSYSMLSIDWALIVVCIAMCAADSDRSVTRLRKLSNKCKGVL
jgi:hypothetical protein